MKHALPSDLRETVKRALMEDIGAGDITAQLVAPNTSMQARVISRNDALLCGMAWFNEVFKQLSNMVQMTWYVQEGEPISSNQLLGTLTGPVQALLTGERTALNFLQLLSGVATQTQRYVQAITGTKARILDTRKTLPNLRSAQKYAVCCGGGTNHRMGLYDAFLIKENHILATGSILEAVNAARQLSPNLIIEVEVETLAEIEQALYAGAERLLLDNFDIPLLKEAVRFVAGRAELEASGGITLETIRSIAETGVDYISIGAITKHVQAIDLSMRIQAAFK